MMHPSSPTEGFFYYTQSLLHAWPAKAAIGTMVAGFAAMFGCDVLLIWLLCAVWVLDFVFGLIAALQRSRFRCRALVRGVIKLPAYCLYIGLVGAVSVSLSRSVGVDVPILNLFMGYLITTDAVSVMGHMIRLGLPVPEAMRRIILRGQAKMEHSLDAVLDIAPETKDEDKAHGP